MHSGDAVEGLFDKQAALKRLGGSVDLLKDMFQFFIEDAPALVDTLETSLSNGQTDDAYRAAHSLKGLASNFDAHSVVRTAKQVEEHLRKGDLAAARPLVAEIRRSVDDCIAAGRKLLGYPDSPPLRTSG